MIHASLFTSWLKAHRDSFSTIHIASSTLPKEPIMRFTFSSFQSFPSLSDLRKKAADFWQTTKERMKTVFDYIAQSKIGKACAPTFAAILAGFSKAWAFIKEKCSAVKGFFDKIFNKKAAEVTAAEVTAEAELAEVTLAEAAAEVTAAAEAALAAAEAALAAAEVTLAALAALALVEAALAEAALAETAAAAVTAAAVTEVTFSGAAEQPAVAVAVAVAGAAAEAVTFSGAAEQPAVAVAGAGAGATEGPMIFRKPAATPKTMKAKKNSEIVEAHDRYHPVS